MTSSEKQTILILFIALISTVCSLVIHPSSPPSPPSPPKQVHNDDYDVGTARRNFFHQTSMATGSILGLLLFPQDAQAAKPIAESETQTYATRALRLLRPKPPRVLRNRLNQDFAILLMRSSYAITDELDMIAMEQFQRDFFILRSSEYELYVKELGPGVVQQGILSDPYYFDFISFAQYLTINRAMTQDPPFVFEEKQPVEVPEGEPQKFVSKLVRRDPSLTKDVLPSAFSHRLGETILQRFEEKVGDTAIALPKVPVGSRPSADIVLESLSQLVKLFLVNGFAWEGNATLEKGASNNNDSAGSSFQLTLVAPATLWGGQCLQLQRSVALNSFLLATAIALVERMGYRVTKSSVKYDGNNEVNSLTLA